jgi:hypothetical protein
MTAVVITAWSFIFSGLYKIVHGYLCTVNFLDGCPVYFSLHRPGETPEYSLQQIIDILYDLSREAGLPFLQMHLIEDRFLKEYEELKGYRIKTEYFEDDNEYAYRTADLLELSGGVNFYKRKRLKKCFENPKLSERPITNDTVQLCLKIEEEWCRHKECSFCESFSGCEKKAMEIMVDIFDDTVYTGLFLYDGETPIGYLIGEKRDEKLSYLYFGKSLVQDDFVYLVYMMYKTRLTGVEYMNNNEDMGNMGLRQFKQHLSAHELWRKNICTFTKHG